MSHTTDSTGTVDVRMDGDVAVLTMAYKPYNLLDRVLVNELISALERAAAQQARAVLLRSALRHFSAGADLNTLYPDARETGVLDWRLVDLLRAFD